MLRRTPLRSMSAKRRASLHEPSAEREPRPMAPTPSEGRGSYSGATRAAVPKPQAYRDPALLEMARGRQCLLLAVAHCHGPGMRSETTVACHENEGKGMAIKAPDHRSVWGCAACHEWYDRSGAPRAEKRRAFAAAYDRMLAAWALVAANPSEPARFRKSAQSALALVGGEG